MRFWLTITIMLSLVVLSFRYGRGPERSVAAILGGNLALSILAVTLRGAAHFDGVDPGLTTIDLATLVGLAWVAVNANRMWPLVVAALQLMVMIAHVSVLVSVGGRGVYWGMMAMSQYLEMLILALGLACHQVRERRYGLYRNWRSELGAPSSQMAIY